MGFFSKRDSVPEFVQWDGDWVDGSAISDGWGLYASMAWSGYLASGRGFILIIPHADDNPVVYVPASRPSLVADRSPAVRQLLKDLARYDPNREIVLSYYGARDEKALRAGKIEDFSGIMRPPSKEAVTPRQAYDIFIEVHGDSPG